MKYILLLFMTCLISLTGRSQTPIKSLYDDDYGEIYGAYYKDTYNDLIRFVGTWKYTSGNTSIEIVLQKKEMQLICDGAGCEWGFYTDIIIGEYKYIENGNVVVNTLSNLAINHENPYSYNITGNIILKYNPYNPYVCVGCGPGDVKIWTYFSDPERDIFGMNGIMVFYHYTENNVEKLRLQFMADGVPLPGLDGEPESEYSNYRIPFGFYELEKQ